MKVNLIQVGSGNAVSSAVSLSSGEVTGGDFASLLTSRLDAEQAGNKAFRETASGITEGTPNSTPTVFLATGDGSMRVITTSIDDPISGAEGNAILTGELTTLKDDIEQEAGKLVRALSGSDSDHRVVIRMVTESGAGTPPDTVVELHFRFDESQNQTSDSPAVPQAETGDSATISTSGEPGESDTAETPDNPPALIFNANLNDSQQMDAVRQVLQFINLAAVSSPGNANENPNDLAMTLSGSITGIQGDAGTASNAAGSTPESPRTANDTPFADPVTGANIPAEATDAVSTGTQTTETAPSQSSSSESASPNPDPLSTETVTGNARVTGVFGNTADSESLTPSGSRSVSNSMTEMDVSPDIEISSAGIQKAGTENLPKTSRTAVNAFYVMNTDSVTATGAIPASESESMVSGSLISPTAARMEATGTSVADAALTAPTAEPLIEAAHTSGDYPRERTLYLTLSTQDTPGASISGFSAERLIDAVQSLIRNAQTTGPAPVETASGNSFASVSRSGDMALGTPIPNESAFPVFTILSADGKKVEVLVRVQSGSGEQTGSPAASDSAVDISGMRTENDGVKPGLKANDPSGAVEIESAANSSSLRMEGAASPVRTVRTDPFFTVSAPLSEESLVTELSATGYDEFAPLMSADVPAESAKAAIPASSEAVFPSGVVSGKETLFSQKTAGETLGSVPDETLPDLSGKSQNTRSVEFSVSGAPNQESGDDSRALIPDSVVNSPDSEGLAPREIGNTVAEIEKGTEGRDTGRMSPLRSTVTAPVADEGYRGGETAPGTTVGTKQFPEKVSPESGFSKTEPDVSFSRSGTESTRVSSGFWEMEETEHSASSPKETAEGGESQPVSRKGFPAESSGANRTEGAESASPRTVATESDSHTFVEVKETENFRKTDDISGSDNARNFSGDADRSERTGNGMDRTAETYMPGTARKIRFVSTQNSSGEGPISELTRSDEVAEMSSTGKATVQPAKNADGITMPVHSATADPGVTGESMTARSSMPTGQAGSTGQNVSSPEIVSSESNPEPVTGMPAEISSGTADTENAVTDRSALRFPGESLRRGAKILSRTEAGLKREATVVTDKPSVSAETGTVAVSPQNGEAGAVTAGNTDPTPDSTLQSAASPNPIALESASRKNGPERRENMDASPTAGTASEGEEDSSAIRIKDEMVSARETRIEKRIQRAEHRDANARIKAANSAAVDTSGSSDAPEAIQPTADETTSDAFSGMISKARTSGGGESESGGIEDSLAMRVALEKTEPASEIKRGSAQTASVRNLHDSAEQETGILNSIVRQARFMIQGGQSSATITLEPPSLGKLKLEIVTENSKITGKILVESKEVRDIIRNNIADLHQTLSQGGLQVESFDVQVGHNGGTDSWARREDMESTAAYLRSGREKSGVISDAGVSGEIRGRSVRTGSGKIDLWM